MGISGPVEIDQQVVDTQSRKRGHQVFDGGHFGCARFEHGTQPGVGDKVRVGLEFGRWIKIHAAEHDAGIRRSRAQGHLDLDAGMQADAGGLDRRFQGALLNHPVILTAQGERLLTWHVLRARLQFADTGLYPQAPEGHKGQAVVV